MFVIAVEYRFIVDIKRKQSFYVAVIFKRHFVCYAVAFNDDLLFILLVQMSANGFSN